MSGVQKVALIGKGLLGSAVLEQLVKAGFKTNVLTRSRNSDKQLPPGVDLVEVDYSSVDSLAKAFHGQDVVISTVDAEAVSAQKIVIDACIQAGVRRYIPSDWGALSTDLKAQELPPHAPWVEIQKYLKAKAQSRQLEYTIFATGPFLDWIILSSFAFDYANRIAKLYDDGNHPFSTTSVASIGRAVAGALKNAEATKNRVVHIHDIVVTQAKLVALAKKYSPQAAKWTESSVDSQAELQKLLGSLEKDGMDVPKLIATITVAIQCGKYEAEYKIVDNELVGLGFMTEEDLDALFAEKIKRN